MKKISRYIVLIALVFGVAACSVDDALNNYNFTYSLVPVVRVNIPDTLQWKSKYQFEVIFKKPSDCYNFSGFNYKKNGHNRIVSVVSSQLLDSHCGTNPDTETRLLDFYVENTDYYVFKFWQGTDSTGQAQYLTKKVVIAKK